MMHYDHMHAGKQVCQVVLIKIDLFLFLAFMLTSYRWQGLVSRALNADEVLGFEMLTHIWRPDVGASSPNMQKLHTNSEDENSIVDCSHWLDP
jgi:hypothetical protein